MSQPYAETLGGEMLLRLAPGARHEAILARLQTAVQASVADIQSTRLLLPRTQIPFSTDTILCPDLALITVATGKPWLAVEVVNSEDHRPDTVFKKQVYEELRLPRLWMVDPRYDNVEVYHGTSYGLVLKEILACKDVLSERLLPEFELSMVALFAQVG